MFELFMKSHKPIAAAMKRWLVDEVIPTILATGVYSIVQNLQPLAVAEPRLTICRNTNNFPISLIKNAIYVLKLPLLNMYKFGYSNHLVERLQQHESDFKEINIELVLVTDDAQEIEQMLKTEMRSHGINTCFKIDGRNLKELFEPEHFNKVCEIAQNIVNNYKSESFTHEQNHEYRMVCKQTERDIEMARELTRQTENEIEIARELTRQTENEIEMARELTKQTVELTKQKDKEIENFKLRIQLEQMKQKIEI